MLNGIIEFFKNTFGHGPFKAVAVLLISMIPVLELRAGIPVGYALQLPWVETFLVAVIGNLIPIPFILLFIKHIFAFMKKHNIFPKLVEKLENRAAKKSGSVSSMEFWGLVIFVGIPLPGTGGWTGALVAALLEMDFKKAMLACTLGVFIAAFIVTLVTYGLIDFIIR